MTREEIINRVLPDFTQETALAPSVLQNILSRYTTIRPMHLEAHLVGLYVTALEDEVKKLAEYKSMYEGLCK